MVGLRIDQQVQISCDQELVPQSRQSGHKFAVNELCQRMSDLSQHSFSKLKRFVRHLK